MLMCSAPVYHDVVDEWKNKGRVGRRKKKGDKRLGERPSYLRNESPSKSRKEDLTGTFPLLSPHSRCFGVTCTLPCSVGPLRVLRHACVANAPYARVVCSVSIGSGCGLWRA
jgi:hypothetical protein